MEQLTIFDYIEPEIPKTDLDDLPETDMVEALRAATGISFVYRDPLWGYEATIGKFKYSVHYSNYSIDDHRRFISCGYGNNMGGAASPCDSLDEAIEWFKKALQRNGR